MADANPAKSDAKAGPASKLTPKMYAAIAVAIFSLLFIIVNWDQTSISFLFFKATMPLTIALALTFVGGAVTGALLTRRRKD